LSEVAQDCLALIEPVLTSSRVPIKIDIPHDLPVVRGRGDQLKIAFANLLKNAVEAADGTPGASDGVRVSARARGREILVSIEDSGRGIPASDVPRLFEPSFTTKCSRGMGIGLYLAQ